MNELHSLPTFLAKSLRFGERSRHSSIKVIFIAEKLFLWVPLFRCLKSIISSNTLLLLQVLLYVIHPAGQLQPGLEHSAMVRQPP